MFFRFSHCFLSEIKQLHRRSNDVVSVDNNVNNRKHKKSQNYRVKQTILSETTENFETAKA